MNRCLLYTLLALVFSFFLLFPIPAISNDRYRIYFKLEGSEVGFGDIPSPPGGVEAKCKVGRAVPVEDDDKTRDEKATESADAAKTAKDDDYKTHDKKAIRQVAMQASRRNRKAIRVAVRKNREGGNMSDWKSFSLKEDGVEHELTVDDNTLQNVSVGELAVTCEFEGRVNRNKRSMKKGNVVSSMKIKVFDVNGNPRFGREVEEIRNAWPVSTWVLRPINYGNGMWYMWFIGQGKPNEVEKLYGVVTWGHTGDYWPSGHAMTDSTAECHPPYTWKLMIAGKYKWKSPTKSQNSKRESVEDSIEPHGETSHKKRKIKKLQ